MNFRFLASAVLVTSCISLALPGSLTLADSSSEAAKSQPGRSTGSPLEDYNTALHKYHLGRATIRSVIVANKKLLASSLAGTRPTATSAAVAYDHRAAKIERLASEALSRGTGTPHELAQARAARLDAMLKPFFLPPER